MNSLLSVKYNVEAGVDDYPTNLSTEEKRWLEAQVRGLLSKGSVLPLHTIVDYIRARRDLAPRGVWKTTALQDFIFMSVERACRAVGEEVWRLSE